MRTPKYQQGIGMLGLLAIAIMVGFFVMAGIKILPGYLEYLTIRSTVMRVAEEFDREKDTTYDLKRSLSDYFNTNQVQRLKVRDVEILRKDGRIAINANFEDRVDLVWRIDALVTYDDLEFIAGEKYSDE